eukprot:5265-Heterococcus_DN1.PRE.13
MMKMCRKFCTRPQTYSTSMHQQGVYEHDALLELSGYFRARLNFAQSSIVDLSSCSSTDFILFYKRDFDALIEIWKTGEITFPICTEPQGYLQQLLELVDYFELCDKVRDFFADGVGLQRAHLLQLSPIAYEITTRESIQRAQKSEHGIYALEHGYVYLDTALQTVSSSCCVLRHEVPPSVGRFADSAVIKSRLRDKERAILALNNVAIAGGRAVKVVSDLSMAKLLLDRADVDLFLYGLTVQAAHAHVLAIYNTVAAGQQSVQVYLTDSAITIKTKQCGAAPIVWQIVLRLYETPAQLLHGFDLSACKCLITGDCKAWATASFLHAYVNKTLIVDPARNSTSYMARVFKYALKKGFSIVVPGFDSALVQDWVYSKPCHTLRNLASLVRMEREYKTRRMYMSDAKNISSVLWHSHVDRSDYDNVSRRFVAYDGPMDATLQLTWRTVDPGSQTVNGSFHCLSSKDFSACMRFEESE